MTKYARLSAANLVLEVCEGSPEGKFHPDIASQFVEVPDDAASGDTITNGAAVKPAAPEPGPEPEREDVRIARETFLACLTRAERIALKTLGTTDDEVEDLLSVMADTNHVNIDDPENTTLFAALVTGGTISQASLDKIYAHRDS